MEEFAAKNVPISHKEDKYSILIEEPKFVTQDDIIEAKTTKK